MKKQTLYLLTILAYSGYAVYAKFSGATADTLVTSSLVTSSLPQTTVEVASQSASVASDTGVSSVAGTTPPSNFRGATTGSAVTASPTTAPAQTIPVQPPIKKTGQYTDGTYTGSVADAYYGNVQVRVTVSGGAITNVTFLQYPQDRSNSRYINSQATPLLAQEAIQAQSANVSAISGATFTSQGFVQSLSAALSQAKNA